MNIIKYDNITAIYEDIQDYYSGIATKTLKFISKEYSSQCLLYFNNDSILNITKAQIEADLVASRLSNKESIIDLLKYQYDIYDSFLLNNLPTGEPIKCGYLKLINIFYGILNFPRDEVVVCIDHIEGRLDRALLKQFIFHLKRNPKIKELFFTTREENILNLFS